MKSSVDVDSPAPEALVTLAVELLLECNGVSRFSFEEFLLGDFGLLASSFSSLERLFDLDLAGFVANLYTTRIDATPARSREALIILVWDADLAMVSSVVRESEKTAYICSYVFFTTAQE